MDFSGLNPNSANFRIVRWVLTTIAAVVLFLAVWEVHTTLLLVLASIILVVLVTMPIRFLMKFGFRRTPAAIISLVGIAAIVVLLILLALPSLLEQFSTLSSDFQRGVSEVLAQWQLIQKDPKLRETFPYVATLQDVMKNFFGQDDLNKIFTEITRQLGQAAGQLGGSVLPVVSGVASTLLSLIIVIFLTLYLLAEPDKYEEGAIKLFPLWYRPRVRFIINRIDFTLRLWLQGQILLMVFAGFVTWLGLAILGLEQALALGVLAGLFSFVPNFGPIAALVPSLVVGLVQSPQHIAWIILIIYGTSFLQSQLIAPLLFKESLNLPPVMVLIGQILAAVFFGFLGVMLAVPMIAILLVLVQEVYIKDILGDKPSEMPPKREIELLSSGN
jgi:predicted PurR-regulated permease PerM